MLQRPALTSDLPPAFFAYRERRHAELNQSQKYTVVAQAVIDRLHTRYTEIESSSTARFGRSASLTQAEYMRIMGDLCMTVSNAEVGGTVRHSFANCARCSIFLCTSVAIPSHVGICDGR